MRYPGGKRRLVPYFRDALEVNGLKPDLFVEPLAGGAGVALELAFTGAVSRIGLFDRDPLVAAFWKVVFWDTDWLCEQVHGREIDLATWMKVTMLLADYAQVAEGKLNVIGGGWSITGPMPVPFSLGLLIEVPWDRTNEERHITLELVDADGNGVDLPQPDGTEGPVRIEARFEVGRPPGLKRGTPVTVPLAINLAPMLLPPAGRFEWRLSVNDESEARYACMNQSELLLRTALSRRQAQSVT